MIFGIKYKEDTEDKYGLERHARLLVTLMYVCIVYCNVSLRFFTTCFSTGGTGPPIPP